MKKLFLLLTLFGVFAVGCENLFPNEPESTPNTIFVTDGDGGYILEADGGEVVVTIATNVDYSIVIPEEAKSWLSVADTRAEARMEKQTFIIAENDTFETRLANVEFVNGNGKVLKTILFSQKCDDKVFATDAEGNYIVIAEGGEVQVAVTTNLEYSVAIPEDAQEWLSVADTRVEIREETLTFIVAENKGSEERSASVELADNTGEVLQTISFIQSAAAQPNPLCPSNEIWYTSVDGNIVEPYSGYGSQDNFTVFGANIVSNKYDADKDCWVITFDGDVTTIGNSAFEGCSSLTSVTIPDSVTTIGDGAFHRCSSLTKFNSKYASEDGRCLIIDGTLNSFAPAGLTEYTIPDSVTTIGWAAFSGCDSLTSITIPDSVTTIGECAFYDCSSLTSITIPDSVTIIGYAAFYNCSSLTSVTIPDSVTSIGDWAFTECSSLTSVTIPDSVTTIGDYAFACCSKLREFNGKYASEDGRCLIIDGTLIFFIPAELAEYDIPDSVTTIGDQVFKHCSSLTSVTIPDSVTTIGYEAFYGCSSLTSVTIPDSATSIGDWAFAECSSLTSVTIGDSVTSIGRFVFYGCSSLTSATIPDSATTIGSYAFCMCESLTSVTIPNSVTSIGDYAFAGCCSLTSLTIPDSVTTIIAYAFYYCSSLTSVYCKATVPPTAYLGVLVYWRAFDDNASGRKIYVPMESVEAYKSAEGWSEYADAIVGYDFN